MLGSPDPGRSRRVGDPMWRATCEGADLHPNLHLKVEGSNAVTTYNYTHDRNRTWREYDRDD
jgi:hypothetical protein